MRLLSVTALLGAAVAASAQSTDFFFRYIGGDSTLSGERLRRNNTWEYTSPGVTAAPRDPADHFARVKTDPSTKPSTIYFVATVPQPLPGYGYYGLSGAEGVADAYRLKYSFYLPGEKDFRHDGWDLRPTPANTLQLRYTGLTDSEWVWLAVKEVTPLGVDKWVPWYVKPSLANLAKLAEWDYQLVDLELVVAAGDIDSSAPGGVEE